MSFSSAGLTSAERHNAVSVLPLRHLCLCLAHVSGEGVSPHHCLAHTSVGGVTYTTTLHTRLWGFLAYLWSPVCDFNHRSSTYFQHPCFLAAFRPQSKLLNATSTSRGLLGTFTGTHSAKKEISVDKHILNSSVRLLESFSSSLLALYTAKLLNQNVPQH